ncbi:hypothetical protein MUK42_14565 [Musa troglodytarum]|uniref:Uncharacterized protein n=1 Tax=Musa troglodytarum TaxID=320322 RepID=A0A9E7L6N3_9LILI|nr:hypothetical protein MUK42_14565 [Musa troglodytarum]
MCLSGRRDEGLFDSVRSSGSFNHSLANTRLRSLPNPQKSHEEELSRMVKQPSHENTIPGSTEEEDGFHSMFQQEKGERHKAYLSTPTPTYDTT